MKKRIDDIKASCELRVDDIVKCSNMRVADLKQNYEDRLQEYKNLLLKLNPQLVAK